MKSISLTVFTIKLMQSMTIFITALITSLTRNLLLAMRSIQMRLMLWRHRQSLLKRKQVELKYRHTDFERYNMGNLTEFLRTPSCGIKDMAKKSIWQMMNRIYEKYSQNFYPMPDMR